MRVGPAASPGRSLSHGRASAAATSQIQSTYPSHRSAWVTGLVIDEFQDFVFLS